MVLPPGHAHFSLVEYESAAGRVHALHHSKVLKWIHPGACEHMFVSVSPTIPIINFYGRVDIFHYISYANLFAPLYIVYFFIGNYSDN